MTDCRWLLAFSREFLRAFPPGYAFGARGVTSFCLLLELIRPMLVVPCSVIEGAHSGAVHASSSGESLGVRFLATASIVRPRGR